MRIPRTIHQTWKDRHIPPELDEMAYSWKKWHPDWQYVLWTDDMNRNFIQQYFPYFLPTYDGYEKNIQRVDAVRYFVLYQFGGLFIDLDFECLANIEPALGDADCVFGKEPEEHCIIHGKNMIISNAFMGCVPQCPFLGVVCEELTKERDITDHPNDRILESTGPFMLSGTYAMYDRKEDIHLLEPELIYPLSKTELSEYNKDGWSHLPEERLKKAFGIHHYAGSWWKKETIV